MSRTLAIFAVSALVMASSAEACRCAKQPSPATAFSRADAVVVAKVLSVSGEPFAEGGATAQLSVSKSWKQSLPGDIDVHTETTCAFDIQVGETYLLYLSKPASDGALLETYACNGNAQIDEASRALKWLSRKNPS